MKLNRLNPRRGDWVSRRRRSGSALVVAGLGLSTAIFVGISGVLYAGKAKQGRELGEAQAEIQKLSQLRKNNVVKEINSVAKYKKERDDAIAAKTRAEAELLTAKAGLSLLQTEKANMKLENAQLQIEIATLKLQLKSVTPAGGGMNPQLVRSVPKRPLSPKEICIGNLHQIQGAKRQWAVYEKKGQGDTPPATGLFGVIKFIKTEPYCPDGGEYKIGMVSEKPTCSHKGHTY
ncbi:MAG: hypothetical protein ACI9VS_000700 [Candidatus Binatia bacterium]|jgi:hypothetical protein